MYINEVVYPRSKALDLNDFKEMDYYAVENFNLPIELMMENAGLQLANLIAQTAQKGQTIKIGIGNGNNGGGGLVAARRRSSWGFSVFLDLFTSITKPLPIQQFNRSVKFGAKVKVIENPDIWVDAYLGFSQKLPLREKLLHIITEANESSVLKISLDIPTGFLGDTQAPFFKASKILTLAAPKKILYDLETSVEIYVADLGIPAVVYNKFGIEILPFQNSNIIKLKR